MSCNLDLSMTVIDWIYKNQHLQIIENLSSHGVLILLSVALLMRKVSLETSSLEFCSHRFLSAVRSLGTPPEYERRGIGSMLIKNVTDEADTTGRELP